LGPDRVFGGHLVPGSSVDEIEAADLATAALDAAAEQPRTSLVFAIGDGPIRRTALGLWGELRDDPGHAGPIIHHGFRRADRLGSHGRRIASAVVYGFIRFEKIFDLLLPLCHASVDDPVARYLAALVLLLGLPTEQAEKERPDLIFGPFAHAPQTVADLASGMDPVDALALGGSLPRWLARTWLAALGAEAGALLAAFGTRPPMAIRVNLSRTSRTDLAARLREEGVPTVPGTLAPTCLVFEQRRNVQVLPSFRAGLFEVQDEGSQLVAALVDALPGERVVDFCAGAGGKSLALADRGARVHALDVRTDAFEILRTRAFRAGFDIVTDSLGAADPLPVAPGWADAVLVDAPCSGSGVLRRHPETRYRLDEAFVARCAQTQTTILERASSLVRPGARLVYATCSLLPQENQEVVEAFVKRHPDFVPIRRLGCDGILWPHRTGTDGFFGVTLERR
jgi:16S rRNA (cytosine967-C5)-methyltransferase